MELNICNSSSKLKVADAIFAREFNQGLVHQVVVAYQAAARSGNAAQKTRAEVQASGRKPWRQKGTGNARAGTVASPIWRSGGVTFAAKPRDYSQKVNKKMYRAAMQCIVSELHRQERLTVIAELAIEAAKTKVLVAKLKDLNIDSVLIVVDKQDDMNVYRNLHLAARNLPKVDVVHAREVTPVALLSAKKVLLLEEAVRQLEERLA